MIYTYDPKVMHTVLIKDVESFPKITSAYTDVTLLLGPGLLTTDGAQHRKQRKLLNPVFSIAHLRGVSHIFFDINHRLRNAIGKRLCMEEWRVLDMNGWMARTTLEMLGQAGLGHSFDNFQQDSTDSYGESLKSFFPVFSRIPFLRVFVSMFADYVPERLTRKILGLAYPFPNVLRVLKLSDTMTKRAKEIVHEKKMALKNGDKALAHQVGEGKDIMSILLKFNMAASQAEKLTDEEVFAQMSNFILAGMDTTSNALSRILNVLAGNPEAQNKLRNEIVEARVTVGEGSNLDIPYDVLIKLPYLDAVCRETLRLYAPVNLIGRTARHDTVLPLSSHVRQKDGALMNEFIVPKDTFILMDLLGFNTNKHIWGEDAFEWRPERWLEPLPGKLTDIRVPGVYSNLMSFSGGTRSCIGFMFSQLEMKVVLAVLLPAFVFDLTEQPIVWNSGAVTYPTMGEESTRPEMLLKVKALAQAS
ncbi:cytochrome P450 [Dichomitus squalens]|uniref:Cytochrome P450 n=1 Tax=Dichomitus squalens TaxID=114155 RepID=A0A4Q9MQG7_9APHY|nr:cytochrome P450 [Dichomitus squalens]